MATYYATHNAGGGGVGSYADPFTLQELLDNTNAGDLGLVCNTGTYAPSSTIQVDNASACTLNNIATIRGANANGSDDGTIATISGSGISASDIFNCNVDSLSIKFEGLRLTAATQYAVNIQTTVNVSNIFFYMVRVDGSTSHGIYVQESLGQFQLVLENCSIDNNTGSGIGSSGVGRGGIRMKGCMVHDNGGDGVQDSNGNNSKSTYTKSAFYDNGAHGINFNDNHAGTTVDNCVFFANTDNGINIADAANTGWLIITNNIFRSNGGYGIDTNGGTAGMFQLCDYNCYHNNTSGALDISTPGGNNITSDPLFTSETDGSENFVLQTGSPCKNTGLDPYGY